MLLLVSLVVFTACGEGGQGGTEPLEEPGVVEEGGIVEEEPLVDEQEGMVGEEPLVEEEGILEEEPLVEEGVTEEGMVEEEPLVEEGVVEEDPMAQEGAVEEEPLVEEGALEQDVTGQEGAMTALSGTLRASELQGNNIMTSANEDLGQVEDIIIGLNNNMDYALMTAGDAGLLDFGEGEMIAVPLAALQPGTEQGMYQYSGDPIVLQNAPVLTEEALGGNLADAAWDDQIFEYWQQEEQLALMPETGGQEAAAPAGPAFIRASELMDQEVMNSTNEDIGNIEDLLVSTQPGAMDYAVMSFENVEGMEITADQLYAIPLNQLNFANATEESMFTFDVDPSVLEQAPSFTADNWPQFSSPTENMQQQESAPAEGMEEGGTTTQ